MLFIERPQDDLSFKTTPVESNDITEVDGVMPSLYKFCARTATGVFQNTLNTIKTALPGNVPEHVQQSLIQDNIDSWTYVASDLSVGILDFNFVSLLRVL